MIESFRTEGGEKYQNAIELDMKSNNLHIQRMYFSARLLQKDGRERVRKKSIQSPTARALGRHVGA